MILAIIGSRNMKDMALFTEGILRVIEQWGMPVGVVSGGAKGADTLGEKWASTNGIPIQVFRAIWRVNGVYNKGAGKQRNVDIISACTHVLAFPSRSGSGTQHSIGLAKKAHKPVIEIWID